MSATAPTMEKFRGNNYIIWARGVGDIQHMTGNFGNILLRTASDYFPNIRITIVELHILFIVLL